MNEFRVLVAASTFWPLADSRSLTATGLVIELSRLVRGVSVLTREVTGGWPEQFRLCRADVHRLVARGNRVLESVRFPFFGDAWCREVSRWIARNREHFDVVMVLADDRDRPGLMQLLRRARCPALILNPDGGENDASDVYGSSERFLQVVDAWNSQVRDSAPVNRNPAPPERPIKSTRESIRQALQTAHPLLDVYPSRSLAICSAPLERELGVFELVQAWQALMPIDPEARLWFVSGSTGGSGHQLYQLVRDLNLEHCVVFPGSFDSPEDIVTACDALILPSQDCPADIWVQWALRKGTSLILPAGHAVSHRTDLPGAAAGKWREPECERLWYFEDPDHGMEEILKSWNRSLHNKREEQPEVPPRNNVSEFMEEMALRYASMAQTILNVPLKGKPLRMERSEMPPRGWNGTDSGNCR